MTGTILGILGLIVTIILGYYGIKLTKNSKQLTRIEFKRKECFSLFDSAIEKLNIDINYLDKKVENPLILLKAEIKNTGTTDIDKNSIYEPLKIIANKRFEWLEINLTDNKTKVNPILKKINQSEIIIEWDLLKVNEKIEIEALIEAKKKENDDYESIEVVDFYNSLNFQSRITNLAKVNCFDRYNLNRINYYFLRRSIKLFILILILSTGLMSLPYLNSYLISSADYVDAYYNISDKKNDSTFISRVIPIGKELILIEDLAGNKQKIGLEKFNGQYEIGPINHTEDSLILKISRILSIIFISLGLLHVSVSGFKYYRKKNKIESPKC